MVISINLQIIFADIVNYATNNHFRTFAPPFDEIILTTHLHGQLDISRAQRVLTQRKTNGSEANTGIVHTHENIYVKQLFEHISKYFKNVQYDRQQIADEFMFVNYESPSVSYDLYVKISSIILQLFISLSIKLSCTVMKGNIRLNINCHQQQIQIYHEFMIMQFIMLHKFTTKKC